MNEHEWAQVLFDQKIVQLRPDQPFRWTSGLLSPIYCDNRQIISLPQLRRAVVEEMAKQVKGWERPIDVVAGTATAGIPYAAWLAERFELPMIYVRSQAKAHGMGKQIEGRIKAGDQVVIVEDLVSTGKSSWQSIEAVKAADAIPLGVVSIFQYGFPSTQQKFNEAGYRLNSLTNLATLLEVLQNSGTWQQEQLATINDWKEDPWAWTAQHEAK
ncbi:orotate phosphoribosyltransferase [Rubeoparvulum massiliense]|uniref:orotate phosphoribosyltransferase n=1 Tax=Rubeoparvulum massiliense TaxID=1631346 RepID=UPI00065E849C|nr:orotate phosphoribosyltransferase [Rubeoparvulum massiliense]